jgi:hypothetical protein
MYVKTNIGEILGNILPDGGFELPMILNTYLNQSEKYKAESWEAHIPESSTFSSEMYFLSKRFISTSRGRELVFVPKYNETSRDEHGEKLYQITGEE